MSFECLNSSDAAAARGLQLFILFPTYLPGGKYIPLYAKIRYFLDLQQEAVSFMNLARSLKRRKGKLIKKKLDKQITWKPNNRNYE